MKELKPKFKVGDVLRAEWDGCRKAFVKIANVTVYNSFVGYETESDQHFCEVELSSDIRIGDIVKSEFNGVVSLVTETGTEKARVVHVDVANNGSFRLITDSEIENLSEGDMMSMIDPIKFAIPTYKLNEYVVASGTPFERFKGVQQILEIKEENNRKSYLIGNSWCCSNDIKKWIPKKGDKVITTMQLSQINPNSFDGNGATSNYNVILKVIEVREQSHCVVVEDYSEISIDRIKPYKGE